MIRTIRSVVHFATVRARVHGFSVRRIRHLYANRIRMTLKTAMFVNGYRCHLHHLTKSRADRGRYYSMLGVSHASLVSSDFTIVLCELHDGGRRLLIIPNETLLSKFSDGMVCKRFYVPQKFPSLRSGQLHSWFDWSLYEDAWHLLGQASVRNASADS